MIGSTREDVNEVNHEKARAQVRSILDAHLRNPAPEVAAALAAAATDLELLVDEVYEQHRYELERARAHDTG